MNLITLALRNLRRRATRTIIVSLSVGLAVASALSLVALADSIKRSVGEGADERGADLTVLSRNASDIFSGFIAEDMKDKLSLIHGIQAVTGELVMYAPIDHDQQKVLVPVREVVESDESFVIHWRLPDSRRGRQCGRPKTA